MAFIMDALSLLLFFFFPAGSTLVICKKLLSRKKDFHKFSSEILKKLNCCSEPI